MPRKTFVIATLVLLAAAHGAWAVWDAVRYVQRVPAPSQQALQQPLLNSPINPAWVRSGKPVIRGTDVSRSPDGRSISGLWSCDGPGSFEWTFTMDETVHVLEGEVHVDYQGHQFTLRPGDSAVFHHGTKALWTVPQHLLKTYAVHKPGPLVRLWRWLSEPG